MNNRVTMQEGSNINTSYKKCIKTINIDEKSYKKQIFKNWHSLKSINIPSVFFRKAYQLDTFKSGIENFGVILKGRSVEKLPQISKEFNDCFIVNNFDPEMDIVGDYLLNKNVVHFVCRTITTPMKEENYRKLNINEVQLSKNSVLGDRALLYAIARYHSLGLRTVFLPKQLTYINKRLFGPEYAKKFPNTGQLAIYYALKIIKPRNLWIAGLDFYQADYLVRRSFYTPIEKQRLKMERINAVKTVQNWIREFSGVNFNIATYFNGLEPQHNLNIF